MKLISFLLTLCALALPAAGTTISGRSDQVSARLHGASPFAVLGPTPDCNDNGVPDATDIAMGTSADCDGNGVPDECDTEVSFTEHPISVAANNARGVWAADLDGDGDTDALSASQNDDKLAWYANDGTGTIGPGIVISLTADGARSIVTADVDGDGDTDVVSASQNDDQIAWYENVDGLGSFGPEQDISSLADGAREVVAADLDGDGDPDALSASRDDNRIAWYENTGSGTWGPQQTITQAAALAQGVFAADLDGDGDLDALSASLADDRLAWYENTDGAGDFGTQQIISLLADGAFSVHAGDADGDGDIDVFAASIFDDEISWYRNTNGQGAFGPQQIVNAVAIAAVDVRGVDVDGDGDLDLLTASRDDDTVAWHENLDSQGGFGPRRVISAAVARAQSVFGADLDGDLDVDILSASLTTDTVAWHENGSQDCNGNHSPDGCDVVLADCDANLLPDDCQLAAGISQDCNATGVPDACEISGGSSQDCSGNGVPDECEPDCNGNTIADSCDIAGGAADCDVDGIPDECQPDCNANAIADTCDIAGGAADCDVDGIPDECQPDCNANAIADTCDIAGGEPDCNGNGVPDTCDLATAVSDDCTGNGIPDECEPDCNANGNADSCDLDLGSSPDCDANGVPDECDTAVAFVSHDISVLADSARTVVSADLDGDGDADAASASFDDDEIAWYENQGGGAFGPQQVVSTLADGAWSVNVADVDGDGDLDLLSASQTDDKIAWYDNADGLGDFGREQVVSVADDSPVAVVAADLDGDADPDLIVASNGDGTVAWYENTDGAGLFGPRRIVSTQADGVGSVFAADLDGDQDIDVASASFFSDRLAWYANTDGAGTFGAQQIVSTAADGPWYVTGADLDGDADVDLLLAARDAGSVAWFENAGPGAFGGPQIITQDVFFPRGAATADVDGDGDLDVVSASELDAKVAWYENLDGQGSFGAQRIVASDTLGAFSVATADVDADGDTDILSASFFDDRIAWHENTGDDCNANSVPDSCEADCNTNGIGDECDLAAGTSADCNANAVPDECDIAGGSADCGGEGVPDECEPDCNANAVADSCDIGSGTSADCNADGVPDECEPDCNLNAVPDACDIGSGTSVDCTANGIPDECEEDCNANGSADSCDLDSGASDDCDGNGVPDECDVSSGRGADCDGNGTLDQCETAVTFARAVISTAADLARAVHTADVDRDGDVDVLSASFLDDKVAWYENTDGVGTFGPQQTISQMADGADAVIAADIDGDLDLDVLSASQNNDTIAWYDNRTGVGGFGPRQVIYAQADGADGVFAADLDGDGDTDVLSSSFNDNRILWFENEDGAGGFGPPTALDSFAAGAFDVFAADLDGDLDLDVLSASFNDDTISWYRNGPIPGTFGPRQVIDAGVGQAIAVFAADLDGDSDADVLAAAFEGDTVAWYENTDGNGGFGAAQTISGTTNGATAVIARDVDGDGDLDAIYTSFFDSRVSWAENLDGNGGFGPARTISLEGDGQFSVAAADIDGNGTLDVATASQNDDTIAWHRNLSGDCNGNASPDACDLPDCGGNGIPDTCETDCNANGAADDCDIASAFSDDCNANGYPDECEPDCNANGVADACDLASATSQDCDANGQPDECQVDCNADGVPDVCDADCNLNGVPDGCDAACFNAGVAALCDTDRDTCHDCSGGAFDPAADGDDTDMDGVCNDGDCASHDPAVWLPPGPAMDLLVFKVGLSANYTWQPPLDAGAQAVTYDTLRSTSAADFVGSATCLETDAGDTSTIDIQQPAPGAVFHYLPRVGNGCPPDNLGQRSDGTPRVGVVCP